MAKMTMDAIRSAILQQSLGAMGGVDGVKGLLGPTQTPLQAGLLGAMQQLAPYTGYTTTPTTFGQAAVSALTGAAGGIQQKKESDLSRALQGLELYSALGDDDDTEFQQNVKRFNKIDAIPEGERSQSEKNEYSILQNKLFPKGKDTETTAYLKYGVLKKIADGVKPEDLSPGEQEIFKLIQRDEDPLSQILKLAGNQSPTIPTKPEPEPEKQINISEMSDQEVANFIKNEKDADKQREIFESLPEERKYEVAPLL